MKVRPAKSGGFQNYVYFDDGEIDALMEEHYFGYWEGEFDFESPGLDMERFVGAYLAKKNIEFDPRAEDSELGLGVLGKTTFNPDNSKIIQIQKSLYENRKDFRYQGRFNFTVAHEAFHALMHDVLFDLSGQQLEFDSPSNEEAQTTCLNRHVFAHESESAQEVKKSPWQEVQANMGASALLMPKTIFMEHFRRETKAYGLVGSELLERKDILLSVIGYLSKAFNASKQAIKYRIGTLGLFQDGLQGEFGVTKGKG